MRGEPEGNGLSHCLGQSVSCPSTALPSGQILTLKFEEASACPHQPKREASAVNSA